jgi:hypothetical protein
MNADRENAGVEMKKMFSIFQASTRGTSAPSGGWRYKHAISRAFWKLSGGSPGDRGRRMPASRHLSPTAGAGAAGPVVSPVDASAGRLSARGRAGPPDAAGAVPRPDRAGCLARLTPPSSDGGLCHRTPPPVSLEACPGGLCRFSARPDDYLVTRDVLTTRRDA